MSADLLYTDVEDDLRAQLLQLLHRHRLDGAAGSHRHERRCLDHPVRRLQHAAPRAPVAMRDSKGKRRHGIQNTRSAGL